MSSPMLRGSWVGRRTPSEEPAAQSCNLDGCLVFTHPEADLTPAENTSFMTDTQALLDSLSPSAQYFLHRYGGLYEFLSVGKSTVDASPVVVYRHVWPYAREVWVRPQPEWSSRFTELSFDDVRRLIQSEPVKAAQQRIKAAKQAAKG